MLGDNTLLLSSTATCVPTSTNVLGAESDPMQSVDCIPLLQPYETPTSSCASSSDSPELPFRALPLRNSNFPTQTPSPDITPDMNPLQPWQDPNGPFSAKAPSPIPHPPRPRGRISKQSQRMLPNMQEKTFTLTAKEMGALTDSHFQYLRPSLKSKYRMYINVDRQNKRITLIAPTLVSSLFVKAENEIRDMAHRHIQGGTASRLSTSQNKPVFIGPKPPRPPAPPSKQVSSSQRPGTSFPDQQDHGASNGMQEIVPLEYEASPECHHTSHINQQAEAFLSVQEENSRNPQPSRVHPQKPCIPIKKTSATACRSDSEVAELKHHSPQFLRKQIKLSAKEMKYLSISVLYELCDTIKSKYNVDMEVDRRRRIVTLIGLTTFAQNFTKAHGEIMRMVHDQSVSRDQLEDRCQVLTVSKDASFSRCSRPSRPPPPAIPPLGREQLSYSTDRRQCQHVQHHSMREQVQTKLFRLTPREMVSLTESQSQTLSRSIKLQYGIEMEVDRKEKLVKLKGLTSAAPFFVKAQKQIKMAANTQLQAAPYSPAIPLNASRGQPPTLPKQKVYLQRAPQIHVPAVGKKTPPPRPPPLTPRVVWDQRGTRASQYTTGRQRSRSMREQILRKRFKLTSKELSILTDPRFQQIRCTLMSTYSIDMEVDRKRKEVTLIGVTSMARFFVKAQNQVRKLICDGHQERMGLSEPQVSLASKATPVTFFCNSMKSHPPTLEKQLESGKTPKHTSQPLQVTVALPSPEAQERKQVFAVTDGPIDLIPYESQLSDHNGPTPVQAKPPYPQTGKEIIPQLPLPDVTTGYVSHSSSVKAQIPSTGTSTTRKPVARRISPCSTDLLLAARPSSSVKGRKNLPPRPPPPIRRRGSFKQQIQIKTFKLSTKQMVALTDSCSQQLNQTLKRKYNIEMEIDRRKRLVTMQGLTSAAAYFVKAQSEVETTVCSLLDARGVPHRQFNGSRKSGPVPLRPPPPAARQQSPPNDPPSSPVAANTKLVIASVLPVETSADSPFHKQLTSDPVPPVQPLSAASSYLPPLESPCENPVHVEPFTASGTSYVSLSTPFHDVKEDVKLSKHQDTNQSLLPSTTPILIGNSNLQSEVPRTKSSLTRLPPPPNAGDQLERNDGRRRSSTQDPVQKKRFKLPQSDMMVLTETRCQHLCQSVKRQYGIDLEIDRKERRILLSGPTSAARFFAIAEREVRMVVCHQRQTCRHVTYKPLVGLVLNHSNYPSLIQGIGKQEQVDIRRLPGPQPCIRLDGNQYAVHKAEVRVKSLIRSIEGNLNEEKLSVSSTFLPEFTSSGFRSFVIQVKKELAVICETPEDTSSPPINSELQPAIPQVQKPAPEYQWSWKNDSGLFSPYTDDVSRSLTLAYVSDHTGVHTIQTNGQIYHVDFQKMLQTNAATGHHREVQHQQQLQIPERNEEKCVEADDRKCHYEPDQLEITMRGMRKSLPKAKTRILEKLESRSLNRQFHLPVAPTTKLTLKLWEIAAKYAVSYKLKKGSAQDGSGEDKWMVTVEGLETAVREAEGKMVHEIVSFQSSEHVHMAIPVPQEWQHQTETETVKLFQVVYGMDEYKDVADRVKATLPGAKISSIQRIQNKWVWEKYSRQKQRLHSKNSGQVNEKFLFHGTQENDPQLIYDSGEGFDMRYSRIGMWGRANYFAEDASYSNSYAHCASDGSKEIFLATVLTGDSCSTSPDSSLRMPPKKRSSSSSGKVQFSEMRYDTVRGVTAGSTVFMTYDNHSAYPVYLIQYR